MGKERIDLIEMLRKFFKEQGYDVWEDKSYLSVSDQCVGGDTLSFVKSRVEKFLMDVYSLGHDVGYSKGLKTMRHIQVKMQDIVREEQKDEQKA